MEKYFFGERFLYICWWKFLKRRKPEKKTNRQTQEPKKVKQLKTKKSKNKTDIQTKLDTKKANKHKPEKSD